MKTTTAQPVLGNNLILNTKFEAYCVAIKQQRQDIIDISNAREMH